MAFTGKTALVTGGSGGIGRAIVRRLARDGARVVFSYRDSAAAAAELAGATGGVAVRADQADVASIDALLEPVGERLDILVNNVAVNPAVPLAAVTAEEFDRVFTVNTKYPLLLMRRAAELMPDGGRIVNISTANTVIPAPGHGLYGASKGALEQLTAVVARELGERGITVNAVSPGATDTDLLHATNPPEAIAQMAGLTALRRLGRPDDIANAVALLAGPDAGWITGQNVRATGGFVV
ncbi:3-oxoacyl-[acyl-carrier protein] reductase [Prauserella shujinwangii]|uniref:3-oxoacyl-[acyl-carrier protein] reductase n=1 Tax=Prauserella shujinwangii TaxID=1453103 RepID=A0A2T0M2A5_9PSEU|nr:SDR family oxidoreductase [Prauserella shujinwangii]PRX50850.1 3-oxoacyl-[acyl-carrier protein] reductase [Prauserella shujinwangii]